MRKSEILDQSPANESDDSEPQRAGIQSVEVGFELLNALSRASGALMLRDLAAAAGMSAAKAHRYLVSFQRLGLVTQDSASTRYDLGPAALRLGLASLSRIDAVRLARERIDALLPLTGHTLAIAVWGNQGPTMVHWTEAPQAVPVALRLGDVMPLLSSATGRCFAAFMGDEGHDAQRVGPMIREELARLKKLPRNGPLPLDLPTSMTEVQEMLDEVRRRGVARVVHSLQASVAGFGAPVFDVQGRMVLAMVVLGSVATLDTDWDGGPATALRDAARRLSADLGHREAAPRSDQP
ncbi:MAG: IclR family transcriptional regulator [Comamonadaceae bacterium]|jgi:DNA-binding IclR family transcriptional regulator|uniref:IclR family transcriptional regulator n=1 Tax=Hydrogenophaga borbori TaxID=2294117 RepID=A0A372EHL1_9BURK|nr:MULTISPECIES: IclR family transcriptional regulator [Hydrogenophaga]NCT97619.1 IclR family transcriptional regulator [Comamonadaceae bacterium]RFP77846.1 IclR family transcriptional regulator [Hydrogenophaga borbori]WQB83169.1 IclR family transcriptional regulator [Hydrogenophaga sp. SNF1]